MDNKKSYILAIFTIILHASLMVAAPSEMLKEYWEKNFNDSSVSIVRRLDYADSLIKYSDSRERGFLLSRKGEAAYKVGNYPRAMEAYRQLYNGEYPDLSNNERLNIIDRMARCENYMGNYDKAVKFAKELYEADKPDSLSYLNANAYIDISQVYLRFQKPNVAKDYLRKATDYITSLKNVPKDKRREIMRRIHLGLSGAEILLGNIDEANKNLEKAETFLRKNDSPINLFMNYAIIYEAIQENEIAQDYYNKILDTNIQDYNKGVALNNYAVFNLMNGNLDKAIDITNSNKALLDALQMNHAKSQLYLIRANIFAQKDDFRQAYHALDSAKIVNDSLFALDKEQEILNLTSQFDSSVNSNMQSSVLKEIGKRNNIIFLLTIILAVAAGILTFLVIKEKRQRKINSDLETNMESIKEQHDREMKSTVEDNEQKDRELTQFAIRFANNNETIEDVLKLLSDKKQLNEKEIESISSRLREIQMQDVSWESFKLYFGQVHKSFFDNLYAVAPNLTQGEIRMSAFVSMNLTAKEIASLTNRSVRTVETLKYRLAKKLPIPPDMSIYDYLHSLQ